MIFASKGAHQAEAAKARQAEARDRAKAQRRNRQGQFAPVGNPAQTPAARPWPRDSGRTAR
jgi:hypothetical protein